MPLKSRWTIPIPRCTVPTFLFKSPTAELSDQPAFIDAERPTTHYLTLATYRQWSKRLAAGLIAAGLQPGDAVLLFSGNTLFFPVVLVGTVMAGGIFTGANPTYVAKEVAYQLENSGARFLICSDASMSTGLEAAGLAGMSKERVFVFDDGAATFEGKGQSVQGCAHWSRLIANEADGERFAWEESEEASGRTIALNYSSGTTGLPKGVEITHVNYVANTMQHMHLDTLKADYENYRKTQRWLCFLPMYHAMAQTIYCVGAPTNRVPVYIMRKFDFVKLLEAIQNFRITDLQLVPPIVVLMAKSPITKNYDLSSVVYAGSGAAPLGKEISDKFSNLWPPGRMNLKSGYGMTEWVCYTESEPAFTDCLTNRFTCSILGWDPEMHSDSFAVGEPNANTQVKLMNEDGTQEVTQGERGEVWGKGLNVMKGYWKNPKATQETLTEDGWLRTGDIAYVDEKGMVFIVDRKKVFPRQS